jgi:hypothetical protein
MWPGKPHALVAQKMTTVDIQNIADYANTMMMEQHKIPRIGRCFLPWKTAMMFWQEPLNDLGIAYKLALLVDQDFGEGSHLLCGITIQYESRGTPQAVFSGAFSLMIPVGGLLEQTDEGDQVMQVALFGDPASPGIDYGAFAVIRPAAERIFGAKYLAAMKDAAKALPTWSRDTQRDVQIILSAISFANCKNVVVAEAGRTSPPPKWVKEGVPTTIYRTVKIDGRLVKRSGESHAESERHLRLHVRRGHFKTFSSEKKLFGKYEGTFWWEQVSRGSAEIGEVVKNYELKM